MVDHGQIDVLLTSDDDDVESCYSANSSDSLGSHGSPLGDHLASLVKDVLGIGERLCVVRDDALAPAVTASRTWHVLRQRRELRRKRIIHRRHTTTNINCSSSSCSINSKDQPPTMCERTRSNNDLLRGYKRQQQQDTMHFLRTMSPVPEQQNHHSFLMANNPHSPSFIPLLTPYDPYDSRIPFKNSPNSVLKVYSKKSGGSSPKKKKKASSPPPPNLKSFLEPAASPPKIVQPRHNPGPRFVPSKQPFDCQTRARSMDDHWYMDGSAHSRSSSTSTVASHLQRSIMSEPNLIPLVGRRSSSDGPPCRPERLPSLRKLLL